MKWIIEGKNIFYDNGITCVATVHDDELTVKHARLIAAAPELLAALEVHHNNASINDSSYHGSQACNATLAAIAKAKGQ